MNHNYIAVIKAKAVYFNAEQRGKEYKVGGANGVTFHDQDRVKVIEAMYSAQLSISEFANVLVEDAGSYTMHYNRLRKFTAQYEGDKKYLNTSNTVLNIKAKTEDTGEIVGDIKFTKVTKKAEVQSVFDNLVPQLIKFGINDITQVSPYIENSFYKVKVNSKLDRNVDRVLEELRMSGLTKDQVYSVVDRVKAQF